MHWFLHRSHPQNPLADDPVPKSERTKSPPPSQRGQRRGALSHRRPEAQEDGGVPPITVSVASKPENELDIGDTVHGLGLRGERIASSLPTRPGFSSVRA